MEPIDFKYSEFQLKFFKRIKLSPCIIETLDDIAMIQKYCSKVFSFENLDIVTNTFVVPLTLEHITDQLLCKNQGGLCYKINFIVYQLLLEFGFNVHLTRGTTRNQELYDRWNIPTAHMVCILNFENHLYLLDCAYGINISLRPIPITDNGEGVVIEKTGHFRIRREENIVTDQFNRTLIIKNQLLYTHVMEFKKSDDYLIETSKSCNWTLGYAFDPLKICIDNEQTIVQSLIVNDTAKEFSVKPISSRLLENGLATLTYQSYTFTTFNGIKEKTIIDSFEKYNHYLNNVFNLPILKHPLNI